jgi:hypothetical protein
MEGRKSFNVIITPWLLSARKLYRPSDRRLSANSVTAFGDRGCPVISAAESYGRFIDQSHYFLFQVAPELCSGG